MKKQKYLISFSESQFEKSTLTMPDDLEDAYYCLGDIGRAGKITRFFVKHVLDPYEFPVERTLTSVSPHPEFICKMYNLAAREQAKIIVNIHWHKFEKEPNFSPLDDECAFNLRHDARKRCSDINVIQIVFGKDSKYFIARILNENGFAYFNNIEIIGPDGIAVLPKIKSIDLGIENIFEKNVLAFSKDGMSKISHMKVTVVGAGGIGSGVLYSMARIGFKYVNIIDPDIVSVNNCNRLYWISKPMGAIGKHKVKFIAKSYREFNPNARIWYFTGDARRSGARRLLRRADLIILCVDNDSIRAVVNSFAAQYCKPLVNIGSGIYMNDSGETIESAGTQIQWFIPREPEYPCLRCHGSLNQKEIQRELMDESQKENRRNAGYISNTELSPEPQVMPLNGIGINIAMWDICSWIIGAKKPAPWTYYNAIKNKAMNIQVKQNTGCTICGLSETSILATGDYEEQLKVKI